MAIPILDSRPFCMLDDAGQRAVMTFFNGQTPSLEEYHFLDTSDPTQLLKPLKYFNTQKLAAKRSSLASAVGLCRDRLQRLNRTQFPWLLKAQHHALEEELLATLCLLCAQFQLDHVEHSAQKVLDDHLVDIKKCATLLYTLQNTPSIGENDSPAMQANRALNDSEKYLKLLGFTLIAPFLVDKIHAFSSGKTVVIDEWMGIVNSRRLYWVWGGGLLSSVISFLPDAFAQDQAQAKLSLPSTYTGYMSWVLYYTRFGINLGLLLKHTINGPWMSAEESTIPIGERFLTQWHARKFSLLNDLLWATSNMVCFFWLRGPGMAGYYGNILTIGLLLFDVSSATWQLLEKKTKNLRAEAEFQMSIADLNEKIRKAEAANEPVDTLKEQFKTLKKDFAKHRFDWSYERLQLISNLVYAVGLAAAFSVCCCFFLPPAAVAPATAMLLACVGAALCFSLTVAMNTVNSALDISKSRNLSDLAQREVSDENVPRGDETLLQQFNALQCGDRTPIEKEFLQKQLFLDMKQTLATSDYQQALATFQKQQMIRSLVVSLLVPPMVLSAILLLPLNTGVAALVVGFCLAGLSNAILDKFKPQEESLPEFNEAEFTRFCQSPCFKTLRQIVPTKGNHSLFSNPQKVAPENKEHGNDEGEATGLLHDRRANRG